MGGAIGLKRVCWRSGVGMHLGGASCKRRWRAVVRGHGRQATGTQRGTKEKKLCIAAAGDVALIRGCQQRPDQDFCSPSKLGGREERRLGGGWRTAGRGPGSEAARALSGCCDTARPLSTSVAAPSHPVAAFSRRCGRRKSWPDRTASTQAWRQPAAFDAFPRCRVVASHRTEAQSHLPQPAAETRRLASRRPRLGRGETEDPAGKMRNHHHNQRRRGTARCYMRPAGMLLNDGARRWIPRQRLRAARSRAEGRSMPLSSRERDTMPRPGSCLIASTQRPPAGAQHAQQPSSLAAHNLLFRDSPPAWMRLCLDCAACPRPARVGALRASPALSLAHLYWANAFGGTLT